MKKSGNLTRRTPLDTRGAARRYEDKKRARGDYKIRRIGRNRQRMAERRERDFGDKGVWMACLPCLVCGGQPSEPHHYPTRGAGGTSKDLTPLCRRHHRQFHNLGAETFQARHRVDLTAEAEHYHAAWLERQDG